MNLKKVLLLILIFSVKLSQSATFINLEKENISQAVNDNCYVGGAIISIDAAIRGDLAIIGEQITLNDSVYGDLIMAGGEIIMNGYLRDDAKIAGNNINILKSVSGDLLVGGSTIQINKDVVIDGDLIVAGVNVIINGTVNGNVKIWAKKAQIGGVIKGNLEAKTDELQVNGRILGKSQLASNTISLNPKAQFSDTVRYWNKDKFMNFSNNIINGVAIYDEGLELRDEEENWEYMGMGILAFGILYILAILLMIGVLVYFGSNFFNTTGEILNKSPMQNFGYGVLYFFSLPFLIVFLTATIVGIPISFILFGIYVHSLLFAFTISSIIISHGLKNRYNKNWNKWKMTLVSMAVFMLMKLTYSFPLIGSFLTLIIISMAFGALVLSFNKLFRK